MVENITKNLKKCEIDNEAWQPIETKLRGSTGYFSSNKNNATERYLVDYSASRRGREFRSKSMNTKKDFGFILITKDDEESVRFFAEEGCTASIPKNAEFHIRSPVLGQSYRQHIHYDRDNRCKPDRGIFISLNPDRDKIVHNRDPIYDGLLVIVEYIKRDAQFIHGTPYIWLPSDRDFFVPSCFVRGFLSFCDEKHKSNNQNKEQLVTQNKSSARSSRESHRDEHRSRQPNEHRSRERSREREHRHNTYDRNGASRHRERPSYESREHNRYSDERDKGGYDRDRGRRDRYDRERDERRSKSSYDNYARDRRRGEENSRENGYDRHSPPRINSPRRERRPSYETSSRDRSRDRPLQEPRPDERNAQYDRYNRNPPQQNRSQMSRDRDRWPEPVHKTNDVRWPETNGNSRVQQGHISQHGDAQNQKFISPTHHRRPMDRPYQSYSHHGGGTPQQSTPQHESPNPSLRHQTNQSQVHNLTPQRNERHILEKKKPFNLIEIQKRLRLRKKRTQSLWSGQVCFDRYELNAQVVSYGGGIEHRLSESKIHFTHRIPQLYCSELIKTLDKNIRLFSTRTVIKTSNVDNIANGVWTAFPMKFPKEKQDNRYAILQAAFGKEPHTVLMSSSNTSNMKMFLIRKDRLKNLNTSLVRGPSNKSEILPANELFWTETSENGESREIPSAKQFILLIQSQLAGHCSIKELREYQNANRGNFFTRPFYNIQPLKNYPNLPQLSQDRLTELIHELNKLRFHERNYHYDIAEFWLKNREYYLELQKFVSEFMPRIYQLEKVTDVLLNEAIFTPDRKSDLTKLITTFFDRRQIAIKEILEEQVNMRNDENIRKKSKRPITPPPAPPTTSEVNPPALELPIMSAPSLSQVAVEQLSVPQKSQIAIAKPVVEPPAKVIILEENKLLKKLEADNRMKDFALIKGNIGSDSQKESELQKKFTDLIRRRDFRLVNCITMRHKQLKQLDPNGYGCNQVYVEEIVKKFSKELEAEPDFLRNKSIKRGVDDTGGYSVRISVERNPVKIKEDKKINGKTAIILPSLSRVPEPDINFVPVFRLGDRIDNPAPLGSPIKTKNLMIDTAMTDLGTTDKFNSISFSYIKMNQSMLQKVRLGQSAEMAEMAVMNDGSDDEAERKGGHIDIPEWVRGVNDYLGNFENILDNKRHQIGPLKGHYILEDYHPN